MTPFDLINIISLPQSFFDFSLDLLLDHGADVLAILASKGGYPLVAVLWQSFIEKRGQNL